MKLNVRVSMARILAAMSVLVSISVSAADWPEGVATTVTLTFDLDAETVWWNDPETMTGNPSSLSQGRYGPTVAVPKILSVLDKHDVKATFFIPSWVAANYPDAVRLIVGAGHEIAAHGVKHVSPVNLSPDEERDVLRESINGLREFSGERPVGYRAPSWAISEVTLGLAREEGFLYSSNRMDADAPYVDEDPAGLVELPVSWILDDAPYFWFDEYSWNKKIHSAADVRSIWQEEFEAAYADGGYMNLTMHPQIIGRPARLKMLDEFIGWMKGFDNVWIATCRDVADHVLARTNL